MELNDKAGYGTIRHSRLWNYKAKQAMKLYVNGV